MNTNTNTKSVVMDLEILQQQYSSVLAQYNSAVNEYIAYLNTDPSVNYVAIQGQAYNGTGSAGESDATTVEQCQADCASLNGCSGATFVSNQCLLRTGDAPLIPATNNSYAIVTQSRQLLLSIEELNQQLISINQQIQQVIQVGQPIYDESVQENAVVNQELLQTYEQLLDERRNIVELLAQYQTLESVEEENNITVNKYYYSYILLLFLAGAIVLLLIKMSVSNTTSATQYGGDNNRNPVYYTLFVIMSILFIINIRKYFSQ